MLCYIPWLIPIIIYLFTYEHQAEHRWMVCRVYFGGVNPAIRREPRWPRPPKGGLGWTSQRHSSEPNCHATVGGGVREDEERLRHAALACGVVAPGVVQSEETSIL